MTTHRSHDRYKSRIHQQLTATKHHARSQQIQTTADRKPNVRLFACIAKNSTRMMAALFFCARKSGAHKNSTWLNAPLTPYRKHCRHLPNSLAVPLLPKVPLEVKPCPGCRNPTINPSPPLASPPISPECVSQCTALVIFVILAPHATMGTANHSNRRSTYQASHTQIS